jgi:hypothetical protein
MKKNLLRLQVLHLFASDYHSGQWSRGYRLQCLVRRAITRLLKGNPDKFIRLWWLDSTASCERLRNHPLYLTLVDRYGRKM